MARLARRVYALQPHLVVQHADAGRPAFPSPEDRADYLAAMQHASRDGSVAVHAYALLTDSVLLLVTPRQEEDLGAFMQRVNRRYVPGVHRRHGSGGLLWKSRFHSAALEPERYLLRAVLMIEQAPAAAHLVSHPLDWPWSSAEHHTGRRSSPLITERPEWWSLGNTPFEREREYRERLEAPPAAEVAVGLIAAATRGWPLGSPEFLQALARTSGREVAPRRPGRPLRLEGVPD